MNTVTGESTIEALVRERNALRSRLRLLEPIYEQYQAEDGRIMSSLFVIGDWYCHAAYRQMIREMWTAIKTVCEEQR